MYTPQDVRRGTSPSRNGKLTISKSKWSRLSQILVETIPLDIDKFKSSIGRISFIQLKFSWVYPVNRMFKVNTCTVLSIFSKSSRYLEVELKASIRSA